MARCGIRLLRSIASLITKPENSDKPCDTGSSISVLAKEFPDIDFSDLDPLYPTKTARYAYTQTAVLQRGVDVRAWLKARSETVIIVVSHSAFLRTAVSHSRYANADYRIFRFSDNPDDLDLVEDPLTDGAGGMGRSRIGRMAIEEGDFQDAEEVLATRPI